ncbi:MAG: hypothetical protein ABIV50_06435 [Opitutus sp.]
MIELLGKELRLELIDPINDRGRLGPRYCAGGYIWQVHDLKVGPLVTGPEWPHPNPEPFNGQGLPESFRHRTRAGKPLTWQGLRGVSLGAGELEQQPDGEVRITAPCVWEVTLKPDRVVFHTRQATLGFDYEIERNVVLQGRTIISETTLVNRSSSLLALEWFAHPFFALTDGEARVEVPAGSTLPENPGFNLHGHVITQKRRFLHLKDGHMDNLQLPARTAPTFHINHPTVAGVSFAVSFAPDECLVWGNNATFSVEPYQTLSLPPGDRRQWNVRYDFGAVSRTESPIANARTPARV